MTITYSIDHVSGTTESVNVEVADKVNMTLQSTDTDIKTGEVVSTYVLAAGDNAYKAFVTLRCVLQTRRGAAYQRVSMTFDTWAVKSDSVAGTEERKPLSGTISFLIPADMTIEVADMDVFIGSLFSFLYVSVSTGTRNTTWLAKLLYGIPQVK